MTTPKRERSINFSQEEVELLTSLVAQHKTILENKKSDAVTWNEKERCWKTLEEIFNTISGTHFRSAKTLKAKYEGIKRTTRKKLALLRAETWHHTGGPSAAALLTPIEEKFKDMILFVDGIESEFDSDHIDEDQPTLNEDSDEERSSRKKMVTYDEKWTKWKRKSPHPQKHPALSAEKMKRPFEIVDNSKLDSADLKLDIADSKLDIADLQKKILEEELLNKRKQWAFEEEEREHKREMWALEKKYFLNKLEK